MKCKAFASQLEAHVGQSPVRGGEAIKTDRKASNNLNQLLSRVKTIFSHKVRYEENQPNSDQRVRNALADIEKYLADNFGTAHSALTHKEYRNGISLASDDPTFSTAVVILTRTNGMLNLPDNIILLGYVETNKGEDYHIEHLGNFIKFLMKLGVEHKIQHFAIAFSKAQYDHPNAVKTADTTCVRLY